MRKEKEGKPAGWDAPIQIRTFRPSDLDRIMKIERAAFSRESYTRKMFLQLYRECRDLFVIAKRARRIAAYMSTCADSTQAELISIAVDPKWRKLGLGSALMRHTLAALKTRKVRRVILMVRTANTEAVRFYRRFGFTRVGRVPGYYEDGAAAYSMRKRL
jgi:ribosomal-protein-alanine N-acetyltransferase